ncbi:MAG: hypothetical protein EVG15_09900 [Candidatus Acididesulfobacter diazotrophicus]|uniref:Uncharacterized protein n=1 Tax=Candidatus Acididesulfobacter diazotrophicus TaxID=2597226 RepID=A0A519BK88_9DELT|nr:MAG: hypothetical protein EVG15_09900 [Candidatus Acididesulfobacter diazotrophicus]
MLMLKIKNLLFVSKFSLMISLFISLFIFGLAVFAMPKFANAKTKTFYCPLGYSFNPKSELCEGDGSLKGYNTTPSTKINVFKSKHHIYICPNKYVYSKKIQLCRGEGSLKGSNVQPTVESRNTKSISKTSGTALKNIKKTSLKIKK